MLAMTSRKFDIKIATHEFPSDVELEGLLWRVYVDGGFTTAESAKVSLAAGPVRGRGELFVAIARENDVPSLIGMAVFVPSDSPARKLAENSESELHLSLIHI